MKNKVLLPLLILLSGCVTNNVSSSNVNNSTSSNVSSTTSSVVSSSSTVVSSSSSSSTYTHEPVQYVPVESNPINGDPYEGMTRETFYANYTEATSYEDALLRTSHGFISGTITYPESIHESNTIFSSEDFLKFDNYTYGVNEKNEIVSYNINTKEGTYKTIYYGAGYITLEEVAAYILAFGEVPANSNYDKGSKGKSESIATWGVYGRVNIGNYSNDVSKYPNEPELPTHDSNKKAYKYTETDIGIAGYNNGSSINRGTYRICFTSSYADGSKITDVRERYVFFTGNHYYDFEEYLNYYGGWGNKFGYETGNRQSPTQHVKAVIVDKNSL